MRAAIFRNVRNWNYKLPERSAILSTLIHQNPEVTFSEERLENKTVSLFLRMSKEPMTRSKKYVARSLALGHPGTQSERGPILGAEARRRESEGV